MQHECCYLYKNLIFVSRESSYKSNQSVNNVIFWLKTFTFIANKGVIIM
jgi:hypothetical protein